MGSMEIKRCEEFIVGFCPSEEFYADNVTTKCQNSHVIQEKEEYAGSREILPFEYRVLDQYREILNEVDKKISSNQQLIAKETIDDEHYEALKVCEDLIELKKISETDLEKIHSLLVLHGQLIDNLEKSKNSANFDVCRICSAIKCRSEACSHQFCKKYEKLRKITANLEKRLNKKPVIKQLDI